MLTFYDTTKKGDIMGDVFDVNGDFLYSMAKSLYTLEYLKALKDITLQNEFDNLYIKITEFLNLDYEISKFRAIELLIFEIMRNRKI